MIANLRELCQHVLQAKRSALKICGVFFVFRGVLAPVRSMSRFRSSKAAAVFKPINLSNASRAWMGTTALPRHLMRSILLGSPLTTRQIVGSGVHHFLLKL